MMPDDLPKMPKIVSLPEHVDRLAQQLERLIQEQQQTNALLNIIVDRLRANLKPEGDE